MKIPFFKTTFGEEEITAVTDVLRKGWVVQGPLTEQFEKEFAKFVGAEHAIFVDSGTSALFLSLKMQERLRGFPVFEQQVETPSLTFVSDAEVIVNANAQPYFIDVNEETMCVEGVSTDRMRIAVHLLGNEAQSPATIYDSAHRIEHGDLVGSRVPWCYSFYATKNMSTVQGGMIAVNDPDQAAWLRKARDHGISKGTRERYTQNTPNYEIDFVGYRVKGDDLRAAIGLAQLSKLDEMNADRSRIVKRYNEAFNYDRKGNHLYPILVKDRDSFFKTMYEKEIQCSVHFLPLHLMPAYKHFPHDPLPVTEFLGKHLVSIPLYPGMTLEEQDHVIDVINDTNQLIT